MTHKLLSSLTASLLIATVGLPSPTGAQVPDTATSSQETDSAPPSTQTHEADVTTGSQPPAIQQDHVAKLGTSPNGTQSNEVVKVGEQQSQTATQGISNAIAKVQTHQIDGRDVATLYVRNLPILSFSGTQTPPSEGVKLGTQANPADDGISKTKSLDGKLSKPSITALIRSSRFLSPVYTSIVSPESLNHPVASTDPVWRASLIASRINNLHRDGVKPEDITVVRANQSRYVIQANRLEIAVVDRDIIWMDAPQSLEQEVLQATNRLRQSLGSAAPLTAIATLESGDANTVLGVIRQQITGWASWYGPGFHGNMSASGERFNQHALTAAHRTLPFGTQVRVTNLETGQSVIVRINDRGPFHGNRVIDLSAGAARVIGLVSAGVARVRLDVLDGRSATVPAN